MSFIDFLWVVLAPCSIYGLGLFQECQHRGKSEFRFLLFWFSALGCVLYGASALYLWLFFRFQDILSGYYSVFILMHGILATIIFGTPIIGLTLLLFNICRLLKWLSDKPTKTP